MVERKRNENLLCGSSPCEAETIFSHWILSICKSRHIQTKFGHPILIDCNFIEDFFFTKKSIFKQSIFSMTLNVKVSASKNVYGTNSNQTKVWNYTFYTLKNDTKYVKCKILNVNSIGMFSFTWLVSNAAEILSNHTQNTHTQIQIIKSKDDDKKKCGSFESSFLAWPKIVTKPLSSSRI